MAQIIALRGVRRLLQLENTSLVGVVRDGRLLRPRDLDRLDPGDSVLVIAPAAQAAALDELFAARSQSAGSAVTFGEFTFGGDLPLGKIAEFYDLPVPEEDKAVTLAELVQARLGRKPLIGDRIGLGHIELIVQGVRGERITEVAIELEPRTHLSLIRLRARLRHSVARVRRRLERRAARRSEPGVARGPEPGQREHER